jgi:hypothetical protein
MAVIVYIIVTIIDVTWPYAVMVYYDWTVIAITVMMVMHMFHYSSVMSAIPVAMISPVIVVSVPVALVPVVVIAMIRAIPVSVSVLVSSSVLPVCTEGTTDDRSYYQQ